MELETAEIQLQMTGLPAAQQALDALGVDADEASAGEQSAASPVGSAGSIDQSAILAALDRQTELLERIADALERGPTQSSQPTY